MRRLLLLLIALGLMVASPPAGAATVRKGPAGAAFYVPPRPLPGKTHGSAIWQRKAPANVTLPSASRTTLLLYRSTAVSGRPNAVSGVVFLPKGKAPRGGWPVITYAHGTVGIADRCAPSLDPDAQLTQYADALMDRWLRHGWAVVRTDYDGLGTPGVHPYLIGRQEGRSVLDMAIAAHQLDPRLSTRHVVIAGHSQGGEAALWAGALAPRYAKALKVRGTDAYAPASNLDAQLPLLSTLTAPGHGLSGELALILRGLDVQRKDLGVPSLLSDRARALYPQTLTQCLPELSADGSFGGMAPADIPRPGADLSALATALDANDPSNLRVRGPVRVDQGEADGTVFKAFTDTLVDALRGRGAQVDYRTYPGIDHQGVVIQTVSQKASTAWIAKRLKR